MDGCCQLGVKNMTSIAVEGSFISKVCVGLRSLLRPKLTWRRFFMKFVLYIMVFLGLILGDNKVQVQMNPSDLSESPRLYPSESSPGSSCILDRRPHKQKYGWLLRTSIFQA